MKRLYTGGTILTMADPVEAEAVVTEDGVILAVGQRAALADAYPEAEVVDLKGHVCLPAFLDAHSHFTAAANAQLQVPLSECVSFAEIRERIASFIRDKKLPAGQWVVGQGYDHNSLAEKCHPTLTLLDEAAPEHPVLLSHQSGHVGVVNSMGLRLLGITPETPSPEGGLIEKKDGKLTGYLEENAFISYQKKIPMPAPEDFLAAYEKAQEWYLSHGIVLVQEGLLAPQMVPLYKAMLQSGLLKLDLVAYGEEANGDAILAAFPESVKQYHDHLKVSGFKIFLDGSPQGRTAYLRKPYEGETEYRGYPTMTDEAVLNAIRHAAREGVQLLAHCNGDGAAEQFLRCVKAAQDEGLDTAPLRFVMIHAQLLAPDQLPAVKDTGLYLSFFPNHVYHWGDVHLKNFGRDRADHISAAASAIKLDIPFTFHQDTPVLPPDMLESVWCAVNRRTKAEETLAGEAISPLEALKAVTISSARQYGEETVRGSIEKGKRADFVILDRNPLTVPPMEIRDIKVLKTIKDDKILYSR